MGDLTADPLAERGGCLVEGQVLRTHGRDHTPTAPIEREQLARRDFGDVLCGDHRDGRVSLNRHVDTPLVLDRLELTQVVLEVERRPDVRDVGGSVVEQPLDVREYKTKYHVGNWPEYERALVQRGDVTVWLSADATDAWKPSPSGRPGGQRRFSDLAIETALTLRLVFRLPLRQTEGFLRSVLALLSSELDAPDHTTLSRRSQRLDVKLQGFPVKGPIHLIVDSTGLSIVGEGEWAAVKHGGRGKRGWKKLHLGVDRSGVIVAQALTEATVDDATTGIHLMDVVAGDLASVTADTAYDTVAIYDAAGSRCATVVVPPTKTAKVSRRRPRSSARDRTINKVKALGRRQWKKVSGYHQRARAENAFFRYKSIIGGGLRARASGGREAEALLACNVLNRMTELGKSQSYSVGP